MDFKGRRFWWLIPGGLPLTFVLLLGIWWQSLHPAWAQSSNLNTTPPSTPVRLVFIHHSVGEGWLADYSGNLIGWLNAHNYFVSDTYYGWGPPYNPDDPADTSTIGDHTDIGYWYDWFLGGRRDIFLAELYSTNHLTTGEGSNSIPQPAGDNTMVLFKSCFISGYLITGNPGDPPRQSSSENPNPIWSVSSGNPEYTVSNIKGMYRDLLAYFAAHQDKLFILITTPPSSYDDPELTRSSAERLRAINTWLVHHWLDSYPYNNVAVFDYYNVLTSNGGNFAINDLGADSGNHHRLRNVMVQHVVGLNNNYSAYCEASDSHPDGAGHQKAAAEFVPLLNVVYNAWKGAGARPFFMGRSPETEPARQLLLLD